MDKRDLRTTEAQRRASLKWEQANNDKITIKLRSDGSSGVTKARIKAAAEAAGQSVNQWIIEAIRDKL